MDAATLAEAMGNTPGVDYQAFAGPFTEAMRAADCTTINRAAMWCAQIGHESGGLRWMEEIADGTAYEWRSDLGNNQPGDGPRFKGSGPIQLTGRANFRAFTHWCRQRGLTDIDFEAQPELVRDDPRWGFLAATFYWATHPIINQCADNGWIWDATRAINGGTNGIQDRIARWEQCKAIGARLLEGNAVEPVEKVLDYSRVEITQDTYYWCGPATTQTLINSRTGDMVPESVLADELGTTVNGTDYVGLLARVLEARIGGGWTTVDIPNDPPTGDQVGKFWADLTGSINAGYGMALNFVAPPSNYPRGSHGSTSPAYGGGVVYHYVAALGFARESDGSRHVWIADSGFSPFGYWASLEQIVSIVASKGYCYPAAAAAAAALTEQEITVDQADRIINHLQDFITGFVGPVGSDVKDIRQQLTGGRDAGEFQGWEQLGQDAQGRNLTLVDAVAALRRDVADLQKGLGR